MKRELLLLIAVGLSAQETVTVQARRLERTAKLPGELAPFQSVDLRARVAGFVETIAVDRGSAVRQGDAIATLSAPELAAQTAEARARVEAIEAQQAEAEARLVAARSTHERMKAASETPGAIAGNELVLAQKAVEAAQALVASLGNAKRAAESASRAIAENERYLKLTAPFDGVVTERYAHPGALAGPSREPLVRLEQLSRLRLVVAVPEADAGALARGARVRFTIAAFPGESFSGAIARPARTLDAKTRTMPVEVDVTNSGGRLSPGMYAEVEWPVRPGRVSLLVPPTAIATTTERTFVIRVEQGKARWVNVRRGAPSGDLWEVQGELREGDTILKRATDEIREGTEIVGKGKG